MKVCDSFDEIFTQVFDTWDMWETRGCIDDIRDLETAERMIIAEEVIAQAFAENKIKRALRRDTNAHFKARERVRTMNYQHKADAYKRTCKRKQYDHKYKGQTRRDCAIVPPDALGWDKVNMNVMGNKLHGIKVGYIFDVT